MSDAGQELGHHPDVIGALCSPGALGSVISVPARTLNALLRLARPTSDETVIAVFAGRTSASDIAGFVAHCDSAKMVGRVVLLAESVGQLESWASVLTRPFCRDVIIESVEPTGSLLSAHVHDAYRYPCSALALRLIGQRWGATAAAVLGVSIGSAFRVSTGSAIGRALHAHRTSLNRRLWADGIRSLRVVVDAGRVIVSWLRSAHCGMRPHAAIRSTGLRDPRAVRRILSLVATHPTCSPVEPDAREQVLTLLDAHVQCRNEEGRTCNTHRP